MRDLLNETFTRVRKSSAPWITLIMLLVVSLVEVAALKHVGEKASPQMILAPFMFMTYLVAFCMSFISRDYTNGTIRNKIILGKSRVSIYFANYIALTVTMLLIIAVYSLVTIGIASAVCGMKDMSSTQKETFIKMYLILIVNVLSFTSVATLLGMACQGVSGTVWAYFIYTVSEIVLMLVEMIAYRIFKDKSDKIIEFFMYFIPSQQYGILRYSLDDGLPDDAYKLPLYSLILIVLTMAGGIAIFRKKNIK